MNDKRGPWFILTGLVLGFIGGLLFAWGVPQSQPINTSPASLRADFKDDYRYMIAAAYTITGDLGRAQARLATLSEANPITALGEQAQRMLGPNSSMDKVRILANLSEALQAQPTQTPVPGQKTGSPSLVSGTVEGPISPSNEKSPTPPAVEPVETQPPTDTPEPVGPTAPPTETEIPATPLPTATLRPARTATPTQGAPFALKNQSTFCDPVKQGLLQILLKNASGQPVPGVELVITWFGGEEHFFTGFKNEISPGYADYVLSSEIEYALSLSGGSTRLTGLIAPVCTGDDGKPYPGTILLEFQQP